MKIVENHEQKYPKVPGEFIVEVDDKKCLLGNRELAKFNNFTENSSQYVINNNANSLEIMFLRIISLI